MDALPALPIIGSGTGWAAFLGMTIYVVRMILNGKLITSREASFREKRIELLESTNSTLLSQNTSLIDSNTTLIEATKPWKELGESLVSRGSE